MGSERKYLLHVQCCGIIAQGIFTYSVHVHGVNQSAYIQYYIHAVYWDMVLSVCVICNLFDQAEVKQMSSKCHSQTHIVCFFPGRTDPWQ